MTNDEMPKVIWVYEGQYDDHTWIPHEEGYTGDGGGTQYRRVDHDTVTMSRADFESLTYTINELMRIYTRDITKAIDIMDDMGRRCDPPSNMVAATKTMSRHKQALAIAEKYI